MTTHIPGPGEDGYALLDEEAAAEALGYPAIPRERSDVDDERDYCAENPDSFDESTAEDHAYAMYEALTDPFDAAVLQDQAAEGQPVSHLQEQRRRELADLRPQLGLGDQVVEREAER